MNMSERDRAYREHLAESERILRLMPSDLGMAIDSLLDRRGEGWGRNDTFPVTNSLMTAKRLLQEALDGIHRLQGDDPATRS